MLVTVKIIADGIKRERDFHLEFAKAHIFAERVRARGGVARIVPFCMGPELRAALERAGINAESIG